MADQKQSRTKFRQVGEILRNYGVASRGTLRRFVEKNYGNDADIPLKILRARDLSLDSENRTYESSITYENVIFDIAEIRLQNSAHISFKNCLFTGDLSVGQKFEGPIDISFFRCILLGDLSVGGLETATEIHIDTVNCRTFSVVSSKVTDLHITACHIALLRLENSNIRIFDTFANRFSLFQFGSTVVDDARFSHEQVPVLKIRSFRNVEGEQAEKDAAFLEYDPFDFVSLPEMEMLFDKSYRELKASTMRFMLEHTNIQTNRDAFAHVKYLFTLSSERNWLVRGFQISVGCFIKPFRLVVAVVAFWIVYACVYALPSVQFNVLNPTAGNYTVKNLSVYEALYFSGVSFTTIGYGDITPNGPIRLVAISEGIVGVSIAGAFLVALTRKYID